MISIDEAEKKLLSKYSDFEATAAIDYKDIYVFALMPKDFDRERDLGFVDSFYSVDKQSGEISGFAPWADLDFMDFVHKEETNERE